VRTWTVRETKERKNLENTGFCTFHAGKMPTGREKGGTYDDISLVGKRKKGRAVLSSQNSTDYKRKKNEKWFVLSRQKEKKEDF